jgi:hypothetical protein
VIELESCVLPTPVCINPPEIEPVAPEANVMRPVFVNVSAPLDAVVIVSLNVKFVPESVIPELPVALNAPLNVVVPLPAA